MITCDFCNYSYLYSRNTLSCPICLSEPIEWDSFLNPERNIEFEGYDEDLCKIRERISVAEEKNLKEYLDLLKEEYVRNVRGIHPILYRVSNMHIGDDSNTFFSFSKSKAIERYNIMANSYMMTKTNLDALDTQDIPYEILSKIR